MFEKMAGEQAILVLRTARDDGTLHPAGFSQLKFEMSSAAGRTTTKWTSRPWRSPCRTISSPGRSNLIHWRMKHAEIGGSPRRGRNSHIDIPNAQSSPVRGISPWPGMRRSPVIPSTPISSVPIFQADFSTFAGDSGGPAFLADSRHKDSADERRWYWESSFRRFARTKRPSFLMKSERFMSR